MRCERHRVDLDADRGPLAAAEAHQAHPRRLGELGGEARVDQVLDLGERQRRGAHREGEDGRIRGIDLAVDRRHRQIGRQEGGGGVDRGLHFLLGGIEREGE